MQNPIITDEVLEQIGVTPTPELVQYANNTLEEYVGTEVVESLSDEQLEHYLSLQETTQSDKLASWLESNVPDIAAIRQDNLDIVLGEIAESAEALNDSTSSS